jgi:hypothetical protein
MGNVFSKNPGGSTNISISNSTTRNARNQIAHFQYFDLISFLRYAYEYVATNIIPVQKRLIISMKANDCDSNKIRIPTKFKIRLAQKYIFQIIEQLYLISTAAYKSGV